MTQFNISHEFECDRDKYWKVFFHEPYNVALYERIGIKERQIIDWKETDNEVYRVIKIVPQRDLPGFIKKIVKGDLGYVETSTLYRDRDHMDVRVEPTLMKDRTKISGTYTLKPAGEGKWRRTFAGNITISIPLVGGRIEKFIIDDMTRAYDTAAEVHREWLKKDF